MSGRRTEPGGGCGLAWMVSLRAFAASVAIACAPAGAQLDEGSRVSAGDVRLLDESEETLPGMTRPRRFVTLGTSLDARVMHILVEEGDVVRAGDVVARLDDRVAAASLALAREEASQDARIERARLVLERSLRDLERTELTYARGAENEVALDEAETSVGLARAELDEAIERRAAAQRRVAVATSHLEQHKIRAPFDGVIVRLAVEEGASRRTGDPIAELADVGRISVDLYLPSRAAIQVRKGEAYALHLGAPMDRVVWARARYVEPRIEPTSNSVRVVFDFEVPAGRIPTGVLVTPATRRPTPEEIAFVRGDDVEAVVAQEEGEG